MATFLRIWKSIPKLAVSLLLVAVLFHILWPGALSSAVQRFEAALPVLDRAGLKGMPLITIFLILGLTVASLVLSILDMVCGLLREISYRIALLIPEDRLRQHVLLRAVFCREEQLAGDLFRRHGDAIMAQYKLRAESENLLGIHRNKINAYFDRVQCHLNELDWSQPLAGDLIYVSQTTQEQRNIDYLREDIVLVKHLLVLVALACAAFLRAAQTWTVQLCAMVVAVLLMCLLLAALDCRKLKLARTLVYYQMERFMIAEGAETPDRDVPTAL